MKSWKLWAAVAAFAGLGASGAQAAIIICGDPALGLRVTTVDPGKDCTYAGLQNPGDPQLEDLLDSIIGSTDATLIERDTADSNGGSLVITGQGLNSGTWNIAPSVWDGDGRVFLYFHFGDAQDNPGSGSTTDPDTFIVELMEADTSGTWSFGGGKLTGLSNIALLHTGANGNGNGNGGGSGGPVPEPATLALVGLGLLGAAVVRRRQRN
jgi:hypothetical protein